MGTVQLELRCPQSVHGIVAEPDPDWSFDALLSEINSLERKMNASSLSPSTLTKSRPGEFSPIRKIDEGKGAFVMRVSDDEQVDVVSDSEVVGNQIFAGKRFACDELSASSDDDYGDGSGESCLMDRTDLVEGALVELSHEHQLGVQDEIRSHILALESDLMDESEKLTYSLGQVKKYTESRREMDRKLDSLYQLQMAEALDSHLTTVQRDHEHWSQIEERKIRNDAVIEDANRKERAIQEEKLRDEQEKAKAEAEAQLLAAKKKAEEAKNAALEANRKEKVAEEKNEAKTLQLCSLEAARIEPHKQNTDSTLNVFTASAPKGSEPLQIAGCLVRSTQNALKLEENRIQQYKELDKRNQALRSESGMDFQSYEQKISRQIKQTSGSKEAARAKANELINIFNDPICPQSISIAVFAGKVISLCENRGRAAFALGHVIVLVTSKFPLAMDQILVEFHRACIYTVPKYISYSETEFETRDAYRKVLGFREEDGKLESRKKYLERLESHMRLYGAVIQTEIECVHNFHGLKEGWAWLARFLNALPPNIYTAAALEAFLKTAGFALHGRYKSQFRKIVKIISCDFVPVLRSQKTPGLDLIIQRIETYIETEQFLREPEGQRLPGSALSSVYGDPYGL